MFFCVLMLCCVCMCVCCWPAPTLRTPHLLPLFPSLPPAAAAPGSREGKLLTDLIKAFQEQNGDAFADALYNYNQISALDNWKVGVLKVAKEHLTGPGGGEGGGGGGDDASLM